MIDLDNLERTLELANDYVDDGLHFLTEPVSYGELKLLAERLISAEKDAARYRELRDAESETCLEFINAKARAASPEWLDGLVDEYMKCSN